MLEVKNIFYSYGKGTPHEIKALSGVSLSINDGEIVSIIGPNGSGKSTLGKHLNALLIPQEGEVLINGINTKKADPYYLKTIVGMVLQNPDNQIVSSIVEEDVAFGPENMGLPSKEIFKKVEEALRSVGLWKLRYHPSHLLSGGQKQKLAIASILAMEPQHIIFDEATNFLDYEGRCSVRNLIKYLNKERKTTIVRITSQLDEIDDSNRVIFMNNGEIILDDFLENILINIDLFNDDLIEIPMTVKLSKELIKQGLIDKIEISEKDLVNRICLLKQKI